MKTTIQAILQTIAWTLVCGLAYPLLITAIAQIAFKSRAEGSLIVSGGHLVGSELIAQPFSGPTYFWPRPSAGGYATVPSGASNLAPTSAQLQSNVVANLKSLRDAHKLPTDAPVPADLVYTSGSGLDPDISPEAARFQIQRVADARHVPAARVTALVDAATQGPQWGIFGEPRVNVLKLNLALDQDVPIAH